MLKTVANPILESKWKTLTFDKRKYNDINIDRAAYFLKNYERWQVTVEELLDFLSKKVKVVCNRREPTLECNVTGFYSVGKNEILFYVRPETPTAEGPLSTPCILVI